MRRPSREFKIAPSELEGRWLLAVGHPSIPVNEYVQFKDAKIGQLAQGPNAPAQSGPSAQVVGQQDGEATVVLMRSDNRGSLQVRLTTDPSSPAVGVNVGAVDQTVTFPRMQSEVAVTIPILAGAPNPGEVDINLTLTPITPRVTTSGPLELRILASDAAIAPKVVSVEGQSHAIVLTFNKPMNPVAASDLNNYKVTWMSLHNKHDDLGALALAVPTWWYDSSSSSGTMALRSATYDPGTNSVTLITRQKINYAQTNGITVSQGRPAKNSGPSAEQSGLDQGLTDLEGNPINVDTTPGKFSDYVFKGLRPTG